MVVCSFLNLGSPGPGSRFNLTLGGRRGPIFRGRSEAKAGPEVVLAWLEGPTLAGAKLINVWFGPSFYGLGSRIYQRV